MCAEVRGVDEKPGVTGGEGRRLRMNYGQCLHLRQVQGEVAGKGCEGKKQGRVMS